MDSRFVPTTQITVTPGTDPPVDIGEAVLGEGEDTMWVKVTSLPSGGCPWPWSYGLLTWISENGRELGTVKVNGVCEGEVFKLGVGLAPLFRTGRLSFTPRSYNLKWIELGHPWTLTFSYATGNSSIALPAVVGAAISGFDPDNGVAGLDWSIEDSIAYLILEYIFSR